MNSRLRAQRNTFLLFLGAVYVSLMAALPIVTATLPAVRYTRALEASGAQPTFEQLDRNHDGYVDRAEAAALAGLEAVFDAADRHARGRLDKVDYAKALGLRDTRK